MKKENYTLLRNFYFLMLALFTAATLQAQVYQDGFGTQTQSHPYTQNFGTMHAAISNPVWTNENAAWLGTLGNGGGRGLSISTLSTQNRTFTFKFDVAAGNALTITSYNFWRKRTPSAYRAWTMAINGTTVGTGTVTGTTEASIGLQTLPTPMTGLTGTVTITILAHDPPNGTGAFTIDDFQLFGSVTTSCTAPSITSISPASGPAGTVVTITGSNFQNGGGTSVVKFNGTNASGFTVVSDNVIRVIVPDVASTGNITVTTGGCDGSSTAFTVLNSNCANAGDIYISELYDQRAGSGGMIELYNPTNSTISLNGYTLQRYGDIDQEQPSNGYILALSGSISPESVYLIACVDPNDNICAAPTHNTEFGSGFNGNDKFELLKGTVVIDRVLVPFTGPGFTLIRNPDAVAPTATYNQNDWNNFQHDNSASNTFCSDLGNHLADPMPPAATITTQPQSVSICETEQVQFSVQLSAPAGFTYQWKTLNTAGAWVNITNNTNYAGATTATLTVNTTPLNFTLNQYHCVITMGSCTLISNAAQLTVSPKPVAAINYLTQPTCANAVGSFEVVPSIGENLTYSLDGGPFVTGTTFTNVAVGSHTITIKTGAGCEADFPVTINPATNSPVITSIVRVHPTCTSPDGTVTINATGTGLTYSIDGSPFQTGNVFTKAPGTYNVEVKNTDGCITSGTVTIYAIPNAPVITTIIPVHPTCTSPNGTVTINATGTGLTYSVDGSPFQTGNVFTKAPGTYNVEVKNAAGCIATGTVTINAVPNAPVITTIVPAHPTCTNPNGTVTINATGTGLTYSVDGSLFQTGNVFTKTSGTYNVEVKNADGCIATGTVTINAIPNAPVITTIVPAHPTCTNPNGSVTINATGTGLTYSVDGSPFQAGNVFTMIAGTYNVEVKNADGCIATGTVTINNVPNAPVITSIVPAHPTCTNPNGSITINATGTGLTYSVDGSPFQTGNVFTMTAGTYNVEVRNADGCIATGTVTINAGGGTAIAITGNQGCRDTAFGKNYILEALPANGSFDIATATFEWRNELGGILSSSDNIFNVTEYLSGVTASFPLKIRVEVTSAAGCSDIHEFVIDGILCDIPKGISPNNDGLNDRFDLTGFNVSKLSIFNRYGKEVYARNSYTNEWMGQDKNNHDLPTGTYYYVIEAANQQKTGWVYVNREE